MDWNNYVKEGVTIRVPRLKASRNGYATRKVNMNQSATLQALLR